MTTTSPTTLTARTPEDLLAAAAVVLGFWPADSVVMLTFDGAHRFSARIDLPSRASDHDELRAMAEALARPAAQHRALRVVLLVYSDDAVLVRAAWSRLRDELAARRIGVVEVLHVSGTRWRSLLGGARGDHDRERLAAHPFLAEAVLAGRVTRDSRDDLAGTLEPDPVAVATVAALVPLRGEPRSSSEVLAEGTWAQALVAHHLGEGGPASDADAARLLTAMGSTTVRDAARSVITRERAHEAVAFFSDLVRRSPPELRAAAAALTGWAAWQAGDGALAWCAVDRCDDARPGYALANTLAEILDHAVPPTAWHDDLDWKEGLDQAASQ